MSRTKPTYFYAIISVALVLFILGLFALLALHTQQLSSAFKEKIELWLELRPGAGEGEVARLMEVVRQEPFVKKESVQFITRQQAAKLMQEDLGDTQLAADLPEMLRDVIRFNVRADFLKPDSLARWREVLQRDSTVAELYYEALSTSNVGGNLEKLGWFTAILGFLLIFAAVTLIHNTIRLALYANRFLIKNQELVGATWEFISRPYLQRGILNGLWSAVLAIVALIGLIALVQNQIPEIGAVGSPFGILLIFGGLIVLGVLISGLSTYFVVNKFLRMRVDDLY